MPAPPTVSFTAYHGTLPSRLEAIRQSGFQPSVNIDDWLGCGTYFFVDGLSDPWNSAIDWAACSTWDKQTQCFQEDSVVVIKAVLTAPQHSVFDLRDMNNARDFHLFRRHWLKRKHSGALTDLVRPHERSYDADALNDFRQQHGIGILIGNFHIQLSVRERYLRFDSRIPNVSVLCLAASGDSSILCSISETSIVAADCWPLHNTV